MKSEQLTAIHNFADFCVALRVAGFSVGGGNDEGIFSLNRFYGDAVVAHTGDPETDPWEWRIRAVTECHDLAFGKFFFRKSGWISREWMPCFIVVRRGTASCEELYEEGRLSHLEKEIFCSITARGTAALHDIKADIGCSKAVASRFDTALTSLQDKLLMMICGEQQKLSKSGEPYGWPSTCFCTPERFFGPSLSDEVAGLASEEARDRITEQILRINPAADQKKISRFIGG